MSVDCVLAFSIIQDKGRDIENHDLSSETCCHRKWRQMGRCANENLLNHQFHAESLNSKCVMDISYIQTKQNVLYLSMISDLYDNSIVAYKTGTKQTVNLVLDTIRLAMK